MQNNKPPVQKYTRKADCMVDSAGQYGHFTRLYVFISGYLVCPTCKKTYPPGLLNFVKLSLVMTWPHANIIGGLASVDCSFETGQAKIEWYLFSGGKGISICSSVSMEILRLFA